MKGNIGLLSAVALGLLILVVLDRQPGQDPTAAPIDQTKAAAVSTANPSGLPQVVLDQPLFQPLRRAGAVVAEPPLIVPAFTEPVAPAPEQPALVGVVIDPAPGGAFLSVPSEGRVVYLTPGQASGGLQLRRVARDRAVFQGQEGEVTLLLPTARELSPP